MAVRLLQTLPKCLYFLGFKDGDSVTQYSPLNGGDNLSQGDNGNSLLPMPYAGIVKSISVYGCGVTRAHEYQMTLMVSRVASSATLILAASQTGVQALATSVAFSAGDTLEYAFTGLQAGNPGYRVGVCAEIETATGVMMFGCAAHSGGCTAGNGKIGGAFGNGLFQDYSGSGGSNTYSLCAVNGSAVRLSMTRYNSIAPPSGGAWIGYVVVDGVVQDGSGLTVDTSCVLDDMDPTATADFTLPLVIQSRYDILIMRSGTNAAFDFHQLGVGIAVQPTTPRQFMLCGGSNDTIPNTGITWKWNRSLQNAPTEEEHTAPVGTRGLSIKSFYVERSAAAGTGKQATYDLLRNGGSMDLLITIAGNLATSGSAAGNAAWFENNLITIQIESTGSPAGGQLHWGIGAEPLNPILGPIAWLEWSRVTP